ncbi:MAG: hypothetical protein ACYCZN_03475 [Candidatus Dormibacteria bacterium]
MPVRGAKGWSAATLWSRHVECPLPTTSLNLHNKRQLRVVAAGIVLAYCILVAARIDQQWPPDFAAFYSIAHALGAGGLGAVHLLYSIHFQEAVEASVRTGAGRVYFEPFMNPWPAAVIVIPFTVMPLRAAFLIWDTAALGICAVGTYWLCKHAELGGGTPPCLRGSCWRRTPSTWPWAWASTICCGQPAWRCSPPP